MSSCKLCITLLVILLNFCYCNIRERKSTYRQKAHSMFMHGYKSYMNHAFPADELMPLSCKGRIRGISPSRGNVDEILGNFSLTLIDSMDTLVLLNELDEFENALRLVINNVTFDNDMDVSVFETNIRVLGGLLSAHFMAQVVKNRNPQRLSFYKDQLVSKAKDMADRLLPAFDTKTGLPYSKINLRYGLNRNLKYQTHTCTACAGTMLLEMTAVSMLTGDRIYEEKAKRAMDFIWQSRSKSTDLVGSVIDIHTGEWIRRESGIGAGMDSYYEYCFKAFLLLDDPTYLDRFRKHNAAINTHMYKKPFYMNVDMMRPEIVTREFVDSLHAFWPGLQVLNGDIAAAIELHEMFNQVVRKHKFLPEAFTRRLEVYWSAHPIRPEFVESTYFLYKHTQDEHYLRVAANVMENIEEYVKVECGYASLKDVQGMVNEDQMESFVLSETLKYLYLIFTESDDVPFNVDDYLLTTEAHFIPLNLNGNERRNVLNSNELRFDKYETEAIREKTKMLLSERNFENFRIFDRRAQRIWGWFSTVYNERDYSDYGIVFSKGEEDSLIISHTLNKETLSCKLKQNEKEQPLQIEQTLLLFYNLCYIFSLNMLFTISYLYVT